MKSNVKHAFVAAVLLGTGLTIPAAASASAPSCDTFAGAATATCAALVGHWNLGHLPATAQSMVTRVLKGQDSKENGRLGILTVSRKIDQECGAGCTKEKPLPESVSVELTAELIWRHSPSPSHNWVNATYSGPGSMTFEQVGPDHVHDAQLVHQDKQTTTVSLTPGQIYTYNLDVQTFVSLTDDLPFNSDIGIAWTDATLTLSAKLVDPNFAQFSVSCIPIPEPGTYALMGCGLAVLGGGHASRRRRKLAS